MMLCWFKQFMGDGGNVMMSKSMKGETVEQQREREAAEAAFQERKNKVKKRREVREKQLQKVLNEKQAVEEELEELRKSAATWGSQQEGESAEAAAFDKKLNKLKKKYEKRIQTLKQENDDIRCGICPPNNWCGRTTLIMINIFSFVGSVTVTVAKYGWL
jgi:DNA gyrase/topoisomerase IV subunit A